MGPLGETGGGLGRYGARRLQWTGELGHGLGKANTVFAGSNMMAKLIPSFLSQRTSGAIIHGF